MKLWQKISLICVAVLLLVVGVCSTLLIINSRDKILSLTIEGAQNELNSLKASFEQMFAYYGKENDDPLVKRTLARFSFSKFAHDTSVLLSDGEEVYSNLTFDPQDYLPEAGLDSGEYYLGRVAGRNILITGSSSNIASTRHTIYVVRDITDVYNSILDMGMQFALVSVSGIIVGTVLIVLLVRLAARPIKSLGRSARRIARGEYAERAAVETKDEIGDLAGDFNVMAEAVQSHFEALKETNERQQLFIGGLTHEFKTPLTSVIGHAETLLYTKMPEDVAERSLTHIHEQCKWLERLTQELLKLITLQEEIELREESVPALLDAVKESVSETLQQRGVILETECGMQKLVMNADLMKSLLINLVDNASKASGPGQLVTIRAHGRTLEVADRGAGIPQEELSRITEPFYRVDKSRSKKMGGAGLGLALAERIADAHGAKMTIESAPGAGTTVRIIFPDNK